MPEHLIGPHGGELVDLYLPAEAREDIKREARHYASWDMTPRQICDVELLLNGAFSPLTGFMSRADYESVCHSMHLVDGSLWPIPITLDVTKEFAQQISVGADIALRDLEGVLIAVLKVEDIWAVDKAAEASQVFGTTDAAHPGVLYLNNMVGEYYIGGSLKGVEPPSHYDFSHLRDTPIELRRRFAKQGWSRVVAFHSRSPLYRAQQEMTEHAAQSLEANLLIHPVVGITQPGDMDRFTRVRCYEHLMQHYPEQTTTLSLLPLAERMAGPREALWHAIVRQNYGCTHFIIGRDHAGAGKNSNGNDFYAPYDAQALFMQYQDELNIEMVSFEEMVYVEQKAQYVQASEVGPGHVAMDISDAELRRRLDEDLEIPEWFSIPEVTKELRKTYPPRHRQGFTLFFTGLSGAGKSTLAKALTVKLMELGERRVTLLDGDIVRKNLSSELGFSKEHRNINVMRIGFVAQEISKNSGIAVCAPIAPYRATRRAIRTSIEEVGGFIEVHVSTPISVCEQRDRKGLYAKARAGLIKDFTGVDDPYETPESPELEIDTSQLSPEEAAQTILLKLKKLGYIR